MLKKKIFILEKSTRHDIRTISVRIKWKNSAYPEQLKPILVALQLFGVMPLTNHKNGKNLTITIYYYYLQMDIFLIYT